MAFAASKAGSWPGRIDAVRGDGMQLACEEGSFDAVVLGLVLCSVPSVERVLAEAFRVLRAGGHRFKPPIVVREATTLPVA